MSTKTDHAWQDDALLPIGRAWMAGIRFVCENGCGVERRVVHVGEKDDKSSRYVKDGTLVKGGVPECNKTTNPS